MFLLQCRITSEYKEYQKWVFPPLSQALPTYPAAHVQLNAFIKSSQTPLFWQGLLAHSSVTESENESVIRQLVAQFLVQSENIIID